MGVFKRLHLLLGILTILHFAITGALMKFNVFGIDKQDIALRMMFRSNHIYILFAAMLNLSIHFTIKSSPDRTRLVTFLLSIIAVSTIALNISFYIDPA